MISSRVISATLIASALTVLAQPLLAKEAVSPSEAVDVFDQICLRAEGDKELEETLIEDAGGFNFVQSSEGQSVAEHDTKDLSFLLLQAAPLRTCILNFRAEGDLIDNFYEVRMLVAAEIDVAESAFAEEGAQIIYRSDLQDILIRPTNGISIAVTYK